MTESSVTLYLHAIASHFPDLEIHSIAYFKEGWGNRLILVNEAWVFRFPLDAHGEQQLLKEIRLLPLLAPDLPLPIPSYAYVAPVNAAYPYSFAGYRLIPGISMQQASDEVRRENWWRPAVGAFLTALHSIPVDRVAASGVTEYRTPQAWRDALAAKHGPYRRFVFPLLAPPQQAAIDEYLSAAIQDERMTSFVPVVLHQDFGYHNFLVDLEARRVTGVIDFGNCAIGDPVPDVSPEILPYYNGLIDPGWDFRRAYYRRTSELEDLLYLYTCEHSVPNLEMTRRRKLAELACTWPAA